MAIDSRVNSYENSAALRLNSGPLSAPVLCRVVSMMLARADCPLDRLDETMLICDALCAHAPAHVSDGHLAVDVIIGQGRLEMRVSELSAHGARSLVKDAVLPEVGNVLERMTDELRIDPSSGDHSEELVLVVNFT
jgi:serine/threonine-protein kinase RsbW